MNYSFCTSQQNVEETMIIILFFNFILVDLISTGYHVLLLFSQSRFCPEMYIDKHYGLKKV